MARPSPLSEADLSRALGELPGWSLQDGKLHREYRFADFADAFGFIAIASSAIEKMDHHPEWSNVYSRVTIDLVTHDAGGVTRLDVDLARKLESIAARLIR